MIALFGDADVVFYIWLLGRNSCPQRLHVKFRYNSKSFGVYLLKPNHSIQLRRVSPI